MARTVHCAKLKKDLPGLAYPPVPGEWVKLQTMMINEYGLNCADPNVRKHLLSQCENYLFGDGVDPIPNHVPVE